MMSILFGNVTDKKFILKKKLPISQKDYSGLFTIIHALYIIILVRYNRNGRQKKLPRKKPKKVNAPLKKNP